LLTFNHYGRGCLYFYRRRRRRFHHHFPPSGTAHAPHALSWYSWRRYGYQLGANRLRGRRLTTRRQKLQPTSVSACLHYIRRALPTSIGQWWRLPRDDKLLIGRRPVRNWTRRTISSLFLCRKLHLFLGKSTKTATTRVALIDSNMHHIVCRLRPVPGPTGGASAPHSAS